MEWNSNMDEAPYNEPVMVRLDSGKEIIARLIQDGSMTSYEESCDQWEADGDDYPECWTGGACWTVNEDEVASDQPAAFARLTKGHPMTDQTTHPASTEADVVDVYCVECERSHSEHRDAAFLEMDNGLGLCTDCLGGMVVHLGRAAAKSLASIGQASHEPTPSREDALREALWTPPEEAWSGLARQMMMGLDMGALTPRKLFAYLTRSGCPIPDWLRDEPEMRQLDHVPSKGTRAVLIYRAMLEPTLALIDQTTEPKDAA